MGGRSAQVELQIRAAALEAGVCKGRVERARDTFDDVIDQPNIGLT